jgi:hypothetical protein
LRPFNIFGYALGTSLAMAGIAALIVISGLGIAIRPYESVVIAPLTETPTSTFTPRPSATNLSLRCPGVPDTHQHGYRYAYRNHNPNALTRTNAHMGTGQTQ